MANRVLADVLTHYADYIETPEQREYPKLSVKLYGRGVVLDAPADGAILKMKRHQLAKAGQVILSEIWGKKGAIGFVPPEGDGALCTSHFFLFDVREDKLDRRWLKAIFDANYLQEQLDAEAKGTTGYAAVRPKILLACEIPLPPLAEQRRVVERIEELAAQIHEARTLRHQADEEGKALIKSELHLLVSKLQAEHESSILGDVTTLIGDMNHEMPSAAENGVAFISPKDFSANETIDFTGAKRISQFDFERLSKKCRPQNGDILLARYGTVGASRMVTTDEPFLASYSIAVVRPDLRQINTRYLKWLIGSPDLQQQVLEGIRGGIQADLGLKTIRQFRIPLPPLPKQRRIVAELDALQAEVDGLKRLQAETADELDALLPAILDKAFKGEL